MTHSTGSTGEGGDSEYRAHRWREWHTVRAHRWREWHTVRAHRWGGVTQSTGVGIPDYSIGVKWNLKQCAEEGLEWWRIYNAQFGVANLPFWVFILRYICQFHSSQLPSVLSVSVIRGFRLVIRYWYTNKSSKGARARVAGESKALLPTITFNVQLSPIQ